MDTRRSSSEQMLDAAAGEALGVSTAEESAAYQQQLADSGENAQRLDRELRQTVARLSAASPYMSPPEDLRGRILQATAPTTFRMEDYRKANSDNRFYKWGFYAAMLFLMAGAWFNTTTNDQLKLSRQQSARLQTEVNERNSALAAFVNPNSTQVKLVDQGHIIGKALVDENARTAVVLVPPELVPPGKTGQLVMPGQNGQSVAYNTVVITVPTDILQAPRGQTLERVLTVKSMTPDVAQKVIIASQ